MDNLGKRMESRIRYKYLEQVRRPVTLHREQMAKRYKQKSDYVDFSAFGVGVKFDDFDHHKGDADKLTNLIKSFAYKGQLFRKLSTIDFFCDHLSV